MLLVSHPPTYAEERAYVLDVVLRERLGLSFQARPEERTDVAIALQAAPDGPALRLPDRLFSTPERHWLGEGSLPAPPLARWELPAGALAGAGEERGGALPILYGAPTADGSFYERDHAGIALGLDVFGGVFFQLTRYEELARPLEDEHARFPVHALVAAREGFLERPLADEYVELLWWALGELFPGLPRASRAGRVLVSHDVDWPLLKSTPMLRLLKAGAGDLVRRGDPGLAAARLRGAAARLLGDPRGDPYNTFALIMDTSERHGLRSAFYFMAGVTAPARDGTYSLDDPWIGELIAAIHARGHELGLHTSYGTYRDPHATRAERHNLLAACRRLGVEQSHWGGRQHFLRWENPITWRNWAQAHMSYDSSLGFSTEPGFRCGTCVEYPVYDLLARERLALRERPLIVMESALLDRPGASDEQVLHALGRLHRRCRRVHGDFTLLWHNSRLASTRERRLFAEAMSIICEPA